MIDGDTGDVISYAALTREERDARAKLVQIRDEQQAIMERASAAAARGQDDRLVQMGRQVAEEMFELINEQLPPRFRKQLEERPRNKPE